jgi:Glycosyl transferase family 2
MNRIYNLQSFHATLARKAAATTSKKWVPPIPPRQPNFQGYTRNSNVRSIPPGRGLPSSSSSSTPEIKATSTLPPKMGYQGKFAVLTSALHEHAYMDAFISHYANLGFEAIYILCDKHQPEYTSWVSMEAYKESGVTTPCYSVLPNGEPTELKVHFLPMMYRDSDAGQFEEIQRTYLRRMIRTIPYEWIMLCDLDEFLFLNGFSKIGEYVIHVANAMGQNQSSGPGLRQVLGVNQIIFPWVTVNQLTADTTSIMDNLDNNPWYKSDRVKALFRKEAIVGYHVSGPMGNPTFRLDTHGTIVNGYSFLQTRYVRSNSFLTHLPNEYRAVNFQNISFMIHFHCRSFKNNVIKIMTNKYTGKSDMNQRAKLIGLVKSGKYNYSNELQKFKLLRSQKTSEIPKFDLSSRGMNRTGIRPLRPEYNNQLFEKLIETYNLDPKYFEPIWANPQVVMGS